MTALDLLLVAIASAAGSAVGVGAVAWVVLRRLRGSMLGGML